MFGKIYGWRFIYGYAWIDGDCEWEKAGKKSII